MKLFHFIGQFFKGAFDLKNMSTGQISYSYDDSLEEFMLLAFSDVLGIELPTTYYSLELYPYLAEDIMRWKDFSNSRKSVWEDKGSKLGFDY
ncbi:MAG: hypothetical protein Q4A72_04710 [Bacillota bacterium]|nr:hypothetical protein [Bacillota bacterium]